MLVADYTVMHDVAVACMHMHVPQKHLLRAPRQTIYML